MIKKVNDEKYGKLVDNIGKVKRVKKNGIRVEMRNAGEGSERLHRP